MTLDELIKALNDIRRVHPDSGWWIIVDSEWRSFNDVWVDRNQDEDLVVMMDW